MNREETMAGFQRLGEYCKAKGYFHRLKGLREHWVRARNGEDIGFYAQSLLEVWQLPPFENALQMRGRSLGCPVCGRQNDLQSSPRTVMILEDRGRFVCMDCGLQWLEPIEPEARK